MSDITKNWVVETYTQSKELLGVSEFNSLDEANKYSQKLKQSHDYIFNIYYNDNIVERLGE